MTVVERERWTAGLEPRETLSGLIRFAVEAELERRREVQALEEKALSPADLASVNERLAELLERIRQ